MQGARTGAATLEEESVPVAGPFPFPETAGQPPTALMPEKRPADPFTRRPEPIVVPQRPFTEVLNDLHRDADELLERGPVKVSDLGLLASAARASRSTKKRPAPVCEQVAPVF